jgi:hypothetical protein
MRCGISENKVMILRRFYKNLNDDFIKEVRLINGFTLDQFYTIVQDYKLLIKIRWKKHQDPLRIPFRSQFRNNNSLLCALLCIPNFNSAQIYKEDKEK